MTVILIDMLTTSTIRDMSYTQNGATPLYIASLNGHTSVVSLLLDKRATVDLPNKVKIISQVKLKPYY